MDRNSFRHIAIVGVVLIAAVFVALFLNAERFLPVLANSGTDAGITQRVVPLTASSRTDSGVTQRVVPLTASSRTDSGVTQELERRVARLEIVVRQLQIRVVELETKTISSHEPVRPPASTDVGDWHDVTRWRRLRKGMTMKEVAEILGQPEKVKATTYVTYWYWGYPSGGTVFFAARKETVDGWDEPNFK